MATPVYLPFPLYFDCSPWVIRLIGRFELLSWRPRKPLCESWDGPRLDPHTPTWVWRRPMDNAWSCVSMDSVWSCMCVGVGKKRIPSRFGWWNRTKCFLYIANCLYFPFILGAEAIPCCRPTTVLTYGNTHAYPMALFNYPWIVSSWQSNLSSQDPSRYFMRCFMFHSFSLYIFLRSSFGFNLSIKKANIFL